MTTNSSRAGGDPSPRTVERDPGQNGGQPCAAEPPQPRGGPPAPALAERRGQDGREGPRDRGRKRAAHDLPRPRSVRRPTRARARTGPPAPRHNGRARNRPEHEPKTAASSRPQDQPKGEARGHTDEGRRGCGASGMQRARAAARANGGAHSRTAGADDERRDRESAEARTGAGRKGRGHRTAGRRGPGPPDRHATGGASATGTPGQDPSSGPGRDSASSQARGWTSGRSAGARRAGKTRHAERGAQAATPGEARARRTGKVPRSRGMTGGARLRARRATDPRTDGGRPRAPAREGGAAGHGTATGAEEANQSGSDDKAQ